MEETKPKNKAKKKANETRKKTVDVLDRPGRNGGKLKTGNTVNVTGRPPILPDIRKAMAIILGKEVTPDKTQLDLLMGRLMELAMDGDTKAAQILLDRGYGKALEKVLIEPESQIKKVVEFKFKDP